MNSDQHSTHAKVAEFHRIFGVAINQPASRDLRTLRARLIAEEANEVNAELACGSLTSIAQELADLVYVAYGTAISLGLDLDRAVAEVHRANLSKLDDDGQPIYRSDGKVLKGPNYRKPDCSSAVLNGAL
jgi:predicted HAD superfamily Cof-like phosphohydrolase